MALERVAENDNPMAQKNPCLREGDFLRHPQIIPMWDG